MSELVDMFETCAFRCENRHFAVTAIESNVCRRSSRPLLRSSRPLAAAGLDELTDAERIDERTRWSGWKSAAFARQAQVTDAFAASQRALLVAAGRSREISRSVCGQVVVVLADSAHKGNRHVGLARTLVHEMPGVLAVLQAGEASEWRATIIARETAHLSVEQRADIDQAIAGELAGWGDARTERRRGPGRSASTCTVRPSGRRRRRWTGG